MATMDKIRIYTPGNRGFPGGGEDRINKQHDAGKKTAQKNSNAMDSTVLLRLTHL